MELSKVTSGLLRFQWQIKMSLFGFDHVPSLLQGHGILEDCKHRQMVLISKLAKVKWKHVFRNDIRKKI